MTRLTVIFLVVALIEIRGCFSSTDGLKITYPYLGSRWQKLKSENLSLFSPTGDDVDAKCVAPFPIQWNITGIIRPADIVKFHPPKRDLINGLYEIRLDIFFLDAEASPNLAASAKIACEMIGNSQIREEFSVFVRVNNPIVQPFKAVVTDSFLIPCPTTDPTSMTHLFKLNADGKETPIPNVEYRPTEGFYSTEIFDGQYICRKDRYSLKITANKTPQTGSHYSPTDTLVRRFSDEVMEFECSSHSKHINLIVDENGVKASYLVNTDKQKFVQLSSDTASTDLVKQGKVVCTTESKELIKEWRFEFIEAPILYLDNFEGEIDCLSSLTPKLVQSVRCQNAMGCEFMRPCLQNVTNCNYKKQKQFHAEFDTHCWVDELQMGKACVSLPYFHLNGLAQCTVQGLQRQWEFFISLEYVRYSNWRDAPTRELIRVEEISKKEGTKTFLCTSSAYLFADSLTFEIEYLNGSRHLIQGNDIPRSNRPNPYRKIYEFNYRSLLEINTEKVIAVHCLAPFWNSSEVIRSCLELNLNDTSQTFSNKEEKDKSENSLKIKFTEGQKHKLECAGVSPASTYLWEYKQGQESYKSVLQVFPELQQRSSGGFGILEFPKVGKEHKGDYRCVVNASAENSSSILHEYRLDIAADPFRRKSSSSAVVILILVCLALGVAFLICYIKKQELL